MNSSNNIKTKLAYLLAGIVLVYSVFFLGIDISRYRTLQQLWDVGHIFLFVLLFYIANKTLLQKTTIPYFYQLILTLVLAILLGLTIEYIQTYTGRSRSFHDVVLDVIGALIGFVFLSNALLQLRLTTRRILQVLAIAITLAVLYPMVQVVVDDVRQRQEFPVLLSANNQRELTRFEEMNIEIDLVDNSNTDINLDDVFRLHFKKGKYSTASLSTFVNDWSDYNALHFTIFNPNNETSKIHIRIHDSKHKQSNFFYADRFTKIIKLKNGINQITISMKDIENAPIQRKMDLKNIDEIMIFKAGLKKDTVLYLGTMWLSK